MTTVVLKLDKRLLNSGMKQIQSATRSVTSSQLNKAMTNTKRAIIKDVAAKERIQARAVRNRLSLSGQKTSERMPITKRATNRSLVARMTLHLRGVPFSALATKQARSKASRVRVRKKVYRDAFWLRGRVYYADQQQRKLLLPKVGLRDELLEQWEHRFLSARAQRIWVRNWNRAMRKRLQQIGAT